MTDDDYVARREERWRRLDEERERRYRLRRRCKNRWQMACFILVLLSLPLVSDLPDVWAGTVACMLGLAASVIGCEIGEVHADAILARKREAS